MCPSPYQWITPPNDIPPPSMATQPPLNTNPNLPLQTRISVPSLQPYTLNVPTCAPLSSQLQVFDGSAYKYRPQHFLFGVKACTIVQFGPKPTSSHQKHIWPISRMASVITTLNDPLLYGLTVLLKLIRKAGFSLRMSFPNSSIVLQYNVKLKLKLKTHI